MGHPTRHDLPAAAQRDHRAGRRRPARPHVRLAAARLGYRCHILTRETDSPAGQVAAGITISDYQDPVALRAFAAAVDVISFEFENISVEGLDLLASLKPVRPAPAILRISQDRVAEKSFVNGIGVPTAPWRPVATLEELRAAAAELGLPAVLKTTRLGYDGKGQRMLRHADDLAAAFAGLAPKPLILEGFIDFAQEISVIVARGADGALSAFDTVENRHRDHILDLTLAPARMPAAVVDQSQAIARRIATALDLVGLLAVEMFVDATGRVLVNELAPRPHNSGHWTIDACPASQFELHIRAIAGLPLPAAVRHADAVMKNLVGPEALALWPAILAAAGADTASVWQGGGAARAQDGPRDSAVSARQPARGVRHRRRAGAGRAILSASPALRARPPPGLVPGVGTCREQGKDAATPAPSGSRVGAQDKGRRGRGCREAPAIGKRMHDRDDQRFPRSQHAPDFVQRCRNIVDIQARYRQ